MNEGPENCQRRGNQLQLSAMKIEHVAYMYQRPPEVAKWYVEHLGFKTNAKFILAIETSRTR